MWKQARATDVSVRFVRNVPKSSKSFCEKGFFGGSSTCELIKVVQNQDYLRMDRWCRERYVGIFADNEFQMRAGVLKFYFRVVCPSGIPGSYRSWSMPTRLCTETQGRLRRCSGKFQPAKPPRRLDGSGNSPTATRSSQRWFCSSSALSSSPWCCSQPLSWAVS